MWLFEITLALLFASALAVAFTPKLHMPLELVLLIGSLCVSFIPKIPALHLNSDAVFYILLPPILFAAAYFTSWNEFKRNIRVISLLAIGLVLFTVAGIGYGVHYLFPVIPLPVGFLLGAIVSPSDASAATAIVKKLGLPRRLLTIIEGESLLNDASALVCYRFAIAAVLSGRFSLPHALGHFFILSLGGAACGAAIGWGGIWIISRLKNSTAETLLSLVTSFAAYLVAERLHVSGIISTVVAGLFFGRALPQQSTPETRMEAAGAWNVVLLALNGIIFAAIGFQLPHVISQIEGYQWQSVVEISLLTTAALIALRFAWVFPVAYLTRLIPSIKKKDPTPPASILFILSWTGMRGIVSLAAAIAIPENLPGGAPFPYRSLIIFVTYVVILITLILPTISLPALVKWLRIPAEHESDTESTLARLQMTDSVLKKLADLGRSDAYNAVQIEEIRSRYERFRERIAPNLENSAAFSALDLGEQRRRFLSQEVIRAERMELITLRRGGKIHDEVFHQLNIELDLEELRVRKYSHPI